MEIIFKDKGKLFPDGKRWYGNFTAPNWLRIDDYSPNEENLTVGDVIHYGGADDPVSDGCFRIIDVVPGGLFKVEKI